MGFRRGGRVIGVYGEVGGSVGGRRSSLWVSGWKVSG